MARRQDDALDELERRITQAEGHRTALNAAVISLTAAGGNVAEAESLVRSSEGTTTDDDQIMVV
jgi:hypothetical protein